MACRSFRPLPCSTRSGMRSEPTSLTLSVTTSETRSPAPCAAARAALYFGPGAACSKSATESNDPGGRGIGRAGIQHADKWELSLLLGVAASGHAAAASPRGVMTSRRFIANPRLRIWHLSGSNEEFHRRRQPPNHRLRLDHSPAGELQDCDLAPTTYRNAESCWVMSVVGETEKDRHRRGTAGQPTWLSNARPTVIAVVRHAWMSA